MFEFVSGFITGTLVSWVVVSAKRKDKTKKALMRHRTMDRAQDDLRDHVPGKRKADRLSASELNASLDRYHQKRDRKAAATELRRHRGLSSARGDALVLDDGHRPSSLGFMSGGGFSSSSGGGSSCGGGSSSGGGSCGGGGGGGGGE